MSLLDESWFCDPADKDGNDEEDDKDSTSPFVANDIVNSSPSISPGVSPHKAFAWHVVGSK